MFKIYNDCTFTNPSSFNWVGLLAIVISIISIFCSFHFVFLGKRIEVINSKFQKFCIQNLDLILLPLEEKFNNNLLTISEIRNSITSCSSDIQLFSLSLQSVYPNIDLDNIISYTETFTDKIYNTEPNTLAYESKLDFLVFKVGIYSKLYDFALEKELNPVYRMMRLNKRKIKS